MGARCEVVVIGAGPYGLATVAHLRARGIETRAFGMPMTFWEERMPTGMFLRSSWEASHIADPRAALTLDAYERVHGVRLPRPIPRASFVDYGRWFQTQVVPDLDTRAVRRLGPGTNGFCLELEDKERIEATRVVLATGIGCFSWRPPEFAFLPPSLVSHASDHRDFQSFAGRRVVIIGAGQSALESAALLHESGAEVEVIARASKIHWLTRRAQLEGRIGPLWRLLYPPTDVGPPGLNWIVAMPNLFRRLPLEAQRRIAHRSIRPAGAAWLVPRTQGVCLTTGRHVVSITPNGAGARIRLDDQTERLAEHVLLATGFRIDIAKLPFLAEEVILALRRRDGYPILNSGFESSVPGLYFVGAAAADSFGPLMRFVSGTGFTARTVAGHIEAVLSTGRTLQRIAKADNAASSPA